MQKYAFMSFVAVTYAEWKGKAFHTASTDTTQTSYIQRPTYMNLLTLKLKLREKCDFRLQVYSLRHAKICIHICGSCNVR